MIGKLIYTIIEAMPGDDVQQKCEDFAKVVTIALIVTGYLGIECLIQWLS